MGQKPTFDVVTDGQQSLCVFARPCPQCGVHHHHGTGRVARETEAEGLDGKLAHRAAHCRGPMTDYWIRFNVVSEAIMRRAVYVSTHRTRRPIDLLAE